MMSEMKIEEISEHFKPHKYHNMQMGLVPAPGLSAHFCRIQTFMIHEISGIQKLQEVKKNGNSNAGFFKPC